MSHRDEGGHGHWTPEVPPNRGLGCLITVVGSLLLWGLLSVIIWGIMNVATILFS